MSVMFTDLKDYTARTAAESRDGLLELVRRQRELVQPLVKRRGGRIVKSLGDGLLIVFDSATDAVLAEMEIQRVLAEHNRTAFSDRNKVEMRIAISTGEVVFDGDDVLGGAVNLASRLQQLAAAGDVFLAETTAALLNRQEAGCEEVGEFDVKGIAGKVPIYRAVQRRGEEQKEM
jgi:class 3 adenylate cyclase